MGVDTKAIIRKGVTLEELVAHAEKKFDEVSVHTTHDDDFFYIGFKFGEENRSLAVFLDPEMAERDYGIKGILLSLKCWGSSTEIAMHFVQEFGGFIDENDCDDIGFEAVNLQKLELAKDFTDLDRLKLKIAHEFGFDKVAKVLQLAEEYKSL